jgi:hypothetical protein
MKAFSSITNLNGGKSFLMLITSHISFSPSIQTLFPSEIAITLGFREITGGKRERNVKHLRGRWKLIKIFWEIQEGIKFLSET